MKRTRSRSQIGFLIIAAIVAAFVVSIVQRIVFGGSTPWYVTAVIFAAAMMLCMAIETRMTRR